MPRALFHPVGRSFGHYPDLPLHCLGVGRVDGEQEGLLDHSEERRLGQVQGEGCLNARLAAPP